MHVKLYANTENVKQPAWDHLHACDADEYQAVLASLKKTAETELLSRDPVKTLELSTRAANVLRYGKISTFEILLNLSQKEVANLYMCGKHARHEIRTAASAVGIMLPNWDESLFPRWP